MADADPAKAEAAALKEAGTVAYKKKDFAEALAKYSAAAEKDPENMVYLLNMGAVYLAMKDYDKVIEVCTKATDVGMMGASDFKLMAKAYGRVGKAYFLQKNYKSALTYYDKALANHRDKEYLAAKKKVKQAMETALIDPEAALAKKAKGAEHIKEKEFAEAISVYTEAIKLNPKDSAFTSRIYSNRSMCYLKMYSLAQALQDAEKVIELDPAWIKGYLRKAAALEAWPEGARSREALGAFKKALEIDPQNAEARAGQMRAQQKRNAAMATMTPEERQAEALKDPEIQDIMTDPVMGEILKQMQTDPKAANEHLKNPVILSKIQKLAAAGLIETRSA
mmetsp:Transcript_33349/g.87466  ORF Transcript_33349/g.87466 Transcript_33349/m.87466 type:complete len:337 (+) Transcript_33349:46-1056(+)|eukprot:CAMPEP_0182924582 /NCGR_PEP_ID=MMETSP0105_2-20130417/6703_1 /TAXON_ID=81532 ORGANISM="Acanthoeca-like sp., Strain 10tr" /NCGR_SAMPLE_ID=MMETSP0105_2 /ASSEMBLY_ACC=CAM_ASM_000205 /LENGTH=336 /DNA_ID=CAMNT_0025062377 /DNA_START=29 /DNA_END=1039 /DNA_ORIENTATION=-